MMTILFIPQKVNKPHTHYHLLIILIFDRLIFRYALIKIHGQLAPEKSIATEIIPHYLSLNISERN